jgi:hypothetical protein
MNNEKIVNVVGVFAVIASLIFVGLELRLTRQLAIIDTEWQLMNNYASWNESVIECPECYVANYNEEMGWGHYWRNYAIILRAINTWQGSEIKYENGLLSERTFNLFYNDANLLIEEAKQAGTIQIWLDTMEAQADWSDSIVFQYLYRIIEG